MAPSHLDESNLTRATCYKRSHTISDFEKFRRRASESICVTSRSGNRTVIVFIMAFKSNLAAPRQRVGIATYSI
jgi:hypothetical protein